MTFVLFFFSKYFLGRELREMVHHVKRTCAVPCLCG